MKIAKYLEQSPVFAVNAAYEKLIPRLNKELKKQEVHLLQGLVITALFFEGDAAVTPSQLADLFKTSRTNMSHILSYLEYRGWVKRTLHPEDARRFHLTLKPEGRKKALSLIKVYDQIQDDFEKKIGAAACQRMTSNLLQLASQFC